jgi:streptogramin lyase
MTTWARGGMGALGGFGVVARGAVAALVLFWGPACSVPQADGDGLDSPGLGSIRFSLTQAPPTARCAVISAEPAMGAIVTRSFELGPGQPSLFGVEGLPTGMVTLTERVYTVSCAALMAEPATWESDPLPATLQAGVSLPVTFSLHLAGAGGQVSVATDFPRTQPVITEFPLAAMSDPTGITTGADGNVWFTQPLANKIARITPAGVVTEFPLPTPGVMPTAIVNGADESLWFTEAAVGVIGRITTTGAIREFAIPSGAIAQGIIAGPDGNVWFLEATRVGRITTSGTVTEVGLAGHPKAIAAGPDNKIWVGAEFFLRVDTTTLAISGLAGVGIGKPITSMVAGSDGAIWFTVQNNSTGPIGRITTAGVRTFFTLPEAMQSADFITSGPDGSLWFTDGVKGALGRVSVAGTIKEFLTPSDSTPRTIATGPEATLWYTDGRGKIGRVRP